LALFAPVQISARQDCPNAKVIFEWCLSELDDLSKREPEKASAMFRQLKQWRATIPRIKMSATDGLLPGKRKKRGNSRR
jgi:hypothetical protein